MKNSGKEQNQDIDNKWIIRYDPRVQSDLDKIDSSIVLRIKGATESKLIKNPFLYSRPLSGLVSVYYKFRVGDYRIVFRIEGKLLIVVVLISHRKDVYKKLSNRI